MIEDLDSRSTEVFRNLVESYLETGVPTGSRTIANSLSENLSAATVRNVMQDLEHLGLLGSPHTSAGRVPTQTGLRLFVDGLLEINDMNNEQAIQVLIQVAHIAQRAGALQLNDAVAVAQAISLLAPAKEEVKTTYASGTASPRRSAPAAGPARPPPRRSPRSPPGALARSRWRRRLLTLR